MSDRKDITLSLAGKLLFLLPGVALIYHQVFTKQYFVDKGEFLHSLTVCSYGTWTFATQIYIDF
ncbi:MAG: hypothetical protein K8R37_13805 [Bacteroidales bacterium]|nr:hypothetical protein [Bacteroidales bacterium]